MSLQPFRALLALAALALATAPGPAALALELRTHTASELGLMASSHLLLGREDAILVDGQLTRAETLELIRLIKASERRLTTVFVTSARPEHYLGLEVLLNHYPDVAVLARPETAATIAAQGQTEIERWRPIYVTDVPSGVVVPQPWDGDALVLDGQEVRVLDLDAEAGGPIVLYVPDERTVFTSDLGFGGVHPWLVEEPGTWLGHLAVIRALGPIEFVYPGRGAPGGAALLDDNVRYLETLRVALATSSDTGQVVSEMREAFPGFALPILLDRSLKAVPGLLGGSRR